MEISQGQTGGGSKPDRGGSSPDRTPNDDRSDVKNKNNDAHAADAANREKQKRSGGG